MTRVPKEHSAPEDSPRTQERGWSFHPFRWIRTTFRLLKFLVVFGILLAMLLFAVALGLLEIPVLTDVFYHPPRPTRVVAPASENSTIDERFSLLDGQLDIVITEEELTAAMRGKGGSDDDQVVLANGELEYHSRFGPGERLVMHFTAELNANRGVHLNVRSMHVGSVSVPPMFRTILATSMLTTSFGTQWLLVNTVTDIDIRDGEFVLTRKIL